MAFNGAGFPGSTSETAERGAKKTPWTPEEDAILKEYVSNHGEGNWGSVQETTGLDKTGKSCRNRWTNYLRPHLKKGAFSTAEEKTIIELHGIFGNKWARIAAQLPGRTDNEVKNFWNIRVKKCKRAGLKIHPKKTCQIHQPADPSPVPTLPSPIATSQPRDPNHSLFTNLPVPPSPDSYLPELPFQGIDLNLPFNPGMDDEVLGLPSMQSPEMVASTPKPLSTDYVIATPNKAAGDLEVMESEPVQGGTADKASSDDFIDALYGLVDNFPSVVPLPDWDDLHPRVCSDWSRKY